MEDDLNIPVNGRRPQSHSNGRQPQYFVKWKTISIFLQMENDLKKIMQHKTFKIKTMVAPGT